MCRINFQKTKDVKKQNIKKQIIKIINIKIGINRPSVKNKKKTIKTLKSWIWHVGSIVVLKKKSGMQAAPMCFLHEKIKVSFEKPMKLSN